MQSVRRAGSAVVLAAALGSFGWLAGSPAGAGSAVTADCPELGPRIDGTEVACGPGRDTAIVDSNDRVARGCELVRVLPG